MATRQSAGPRLVGRSWGPRGAACRFSSRTSWMIRKLHFLGDSGIPGSMPDDRSIRTKPSDHEAGPLAAYPRVPLGHAPTPLEHLARLSAALGGPEIWVKRDDCTGLGMGGNKVRKLEYLMGEVRAQGARTVITVGGVQSNHARQTAAAAARLGLRCELVLPRVVPRTGTDYERSGNVLLDELFGAEVFVVDDEMDAARMIQERVEAANRRGEPAAVHPPGGSTPTGALGYVHAALECDAQMKAGAPAVGDHEKP